MRYLRKSSLKHILTLFIHWNFNFIGKMILECWLIGWFIPHGITPFSESEFPAIATCFFFLFYLFSLETIHLGPLHVHLLAWGIALVCNYTEVIVGWVCLCVQSQCEIPQLLGEAGSTRGHAGISIQNCPFPKSWVFAF